MIKHFLNISISFLILSGVTPLLPPAYAGQRHVKTQIEEDDEKNTISLPRFFSYEISPPFSFEESSKIWPHEILLHIFSYVESKHFPKIRMACTHWHRCGYDALTLRLPALECEYQHSVTLSSNQSLTNSSNSSQASVSSHLQNFIDQLRIFPECHKALCAMYANLDPCKDFDSIKSAVHVVKSIPNIKAILQNNLNIFNFQFKKEFKQKLLIEEVREKNIRKFINQSSESYPLLKNFFMSLYLLGKGGDKKANGIRSLWHTIMAHSLHLFKDGLDSKENAKVKKMSPILDKNGHLLKPPFWTAYLAFEDGLPCLQLKLYIAIMNSALVTHVDPATIDSYLVFCCKSFPQATYRLEAAIARVGFQISQFLKNSHSNTEDKSKKSKKKK